MKGPEPNFSNLGCNLRLSIYLDNIVQGYQSALFVLQELPCVTNAVCGMLGPILRKYWL